MTQKYNISGMTCKSCVGRVTSELLKLGDITVADVQLEAPQATITMQHPVIVRELQQAVQRAGNYHITEAASDSQEVQPPPTKDSWASTYKPLLLIAAYITGTTILLQLSNGDFSAGVWMRHFMAAFFLSFSFFKLLDLKGFAASYATYDIVARRWRGWGYVYPFVELGLGLAYLLRLAPLATNITTFVVMAVGLAAVLQAVYKKHRIQCACLGSVFNLPMSTVTIAEDGIMAGMSLLMIAMLNGK